MRSRRGSPEQVGSVGPARRTRGRPPVDRGVTGSLVAAVGVLGLLRIAPRPDVAVVTRAALAGGRRPLAQTAAGVATNLPNPKIGVFHTSVLPQLVPRHGPTAATQAGLVLADAGLSLVRLNAWAWGLGHPRGLAGRPLAGRALERVGGAALVGFGLEIAAGTR
jgi:threonine/homoserine/homoserine lactone efflux protein